MNRFLSAIVGASMMAFCAASYAGQSSASVVAVTHIDIVRSHLDTATMLLQDYAVATQHAPGLEKVEVLRQMGNVNNHFTLVEFWASQSAHSAYVSSAPVRDFHQKLDHILGSPHDEQIYTEVAAHMPG